jgi:hypothetical protein
MNKSIYFPTLLYHKHLISELLTFVLHTSDK